MRNNLNLKSILLAGMLLLGFGIGRAQSDRAFYRDYEGMVGAMTGKVRQYMAAHPEVRIDSIRKHVYQVKLEGTITHAEPLQKERTKHLSADKIYELGCKSSLIFGKMEHMDAIGKDTAYITASAVALTKDGICATNYHVVADVVLSGALDYAPKGDEMRFVMDHDGRVYPMTEILYVDPINDFALFRVDASEHALTPASIGGNRAPGKTVYCLSHPSSARYYLTEGIVANCVREENSQNGRSRYILEITADYGVGASGGPIYDDCGNLVALVSSTFSLYANPQQNQNFQMTYKYTVPVFLLKECF
jgi:S1-C subfamily serine protease